MDNDDVAATIIADNSYLKVACPITDLILPNEPNESVLGALLIIALIALTPFVMSLDWAIIKKA
jgi:hypothetical protein